MVHASWYLILYCAGLHNVCVCTFHQNEKLMVNTVNTSLNYKDVLKLCVCSTENSNCVLHHLCELTEYHFIAKKQSEILRVKKVSLKFDEAVLILDFGENYSFVIQDCAQSYHWNNAQATIHAFVLYCLNPKIKEISSASFSCISCHMTHNIITVYAFLKTLINDHIKTRYPFLKSISYFIDGSPAQYKNYKNFTNLLMHKKDFGMKAGWHFCATSHDKNACDGVRVL